MAEDTAGFDGTTALVTGGGSGIGRAAAQRLAARGTAVTVADINGAAADETVRLISAAGGVASSAQCDIADEAAVRAAVAASSASGRLDYAVNCAGLRGPGMPVPLAEYDTDLFDRLVAVNLRGTFLCLKYEISAMLPAGTGSVVNISSAAGVQGVPGTAGYTGSKHGIIGITKTAALDYGPAGIRVNAICPGLIDTPMNQSGRTPEHMAAMISSIPLKRKGAPAEIADAIAWLCSPQSSFVSGAVLGVDGGRSAQR